MKLQKHNQETKASHFKERKSITTVLTRSGSKAADAALPEKEKVDAANHPMESLTQVKSTTIVDKICVPTMASLT